MYDLRAAIWRWTRTSAAVGAPFGLASAAAAYLLHSALDAEQALSASGFSDIGGPSILLLLLCAVGGYVAGVLADRSLGVEGVLALAFVGASAAVSLLVSVAAYALFTATLQPYLLFINVVGVLIWLAAGAKRIYLD